MSREIQHDSRGGIHLTIYHDELRSAHHQPEWTSHGPDDHRERQILLEADEFTTRHNLDYARDTIRKGALLASNVDIDRVDGLTRDELVIIGNEKSKNWHRHSGLSQVVYGCCGFGFLAGWNMFSLALPHSYLRVSDRLLQTKPANEEKLPMIFLVECLIALAGCWSTYIVNHSIGRRGAVFLSFILTFIDSVGETVGLRWQQLLIFRVLLAFGVGLQACTIPVYLAESSPTMSREKMLRLCSIATYVGFFFSGLTSACETAAPSIASFLNVCYPILSAILPMLVWFFPESPRWYVSHWQMDKAYESLLHLRGVEILAAQDLWQIQSHISTEEGKFGRKRFHTKLVQLITVPRIRRATIASSITIITATLSGTGLLVGSFEQLIALFINIFTDGYVVPAPIMPVYVHLAIFMATMLGLAMIDILGRRRAIFISLSGLICLLIWMRLFFPSRHSQMMMVLVSGCFLISLSSIGAGFLFLSYAAKVFPIYHREIGMAFTFSIYHVCQNLAKIMLILPLAVGSSSTKLLHAFALMHAILFCASFLVIRETKQHSLEEISSIFKLSTRKLVRYRLSKELPYMINRYILRRHVRLDDIDRQQQYPTHSRYTDEGGVVVDENDYQDSLV
ncbi:hypothetical protein MW887_007641 [Aspergillus wentii]|nr:hypothetical protein MW887_007641 [Aspergillus wentii]